MILNILFHDLLGPSLPDGIQGHQMLRVGFDLIIIGGDHSSDIESTNHKKNKLNDSIYRLSCSNNSCHWNSKVLPLNWEKRTEFVAVAIPDDFVECG